MNEQSVKDKILSVIKTREVLLELFPEWDGDNKTLIPCPRAKTHHEAGNDDTASFSLNGDTGEFNCFGCGFHGTSVIGLLTDIKYGGNFKKTLAVLYNRYVGPVVNKAELLRKHEILLGNPSILRAIATARHWSVDTIKRFKLGWDKESKRITIPIYTAVGFVVDVRYHDTIRKAPLVNGKRVPVLARKNATNGSLFPIFPTINPFAVTEEEIWILEGEPDVILARQEGLNAITITGGAGQWLKISDEILRMFQYKNVIICLDRDKAGQETALKLSERFAGVDVASLKNVVVPDGKDFTEFVVDHGGSGDLLRQISRIEPYIIKPRSATTHVLPLSETSDAKYIGTTVVTDVIINGKHRAPFVAPRKIQLSCATEDRCARCPCANATGIAEHFINPTDADVLDWVKQEPRTKIRRDLNLPNRCPLAVEIISFQNFEAVSLIPSLSLSAGKDKESFCQRAGFYAGHGIEANKAYRVKAVPTRLPGSNESALLIEQADSSQNTVENFTLKKEEIAKLKELMSDPPLQILKDVADMLSNNHTKIYERREVHIAVALAFHSVSNFVFAGTAIPKGSIELLLFGDTRCGKGQVAEGMARFYDLGAVISGEASSFMGLFGGVTRIADSFQLTWGAIPLNNGRLVIIDEFSGLASDDLGRLSRVRSEGIAEMNKGGITAKTRANTRLIWIANPRKGRAVASFGSGAQAIMDLIKAAEDVARFDLAVVVQKDEVDPTIINRLHTTVQSKYTQNDLRTIVLWAWSRKTDHIIFTKEATDYILETANKLASRYTSSIPLVQGENIRFKLAKLAVAVAAQCFSTEDGVFLRVTVAHAKAATSFLVACYDKPTMGYKLVSTIEAKSGNSVDELALDRWFEQFDKERKALIIDALIEADVITARDIEDATDHEPGRCKKHLGIFVRSHALKLGKKGEYEKRPAFIKYLKERRK
jgi:hypothetical protein